MTTPSNIVLAQLENLTLWSTIICPEEGCNQLIRSLNIGDEEVLANDFEPVFRESDGYVTEYINRMTRKKDGKVVFKRVLTVPDLIRKDDSRTLLNSIREFCLERERARDQSLAQSQAQEPADIEDTELAQSMSALAVSRSEDDPDSGLGDDPSEGGSG